MFRKRERVKSKCRKKRHYDNLNKVTKKNVQKKERVKSESDESSDNYRIYNRPVDLF